MIRKIVRVIFALAGVGVGSGLVKLFYPFVQVFHIKIGYLFLPIFYGIVFVLFGVLFFFIAPVIMDAMIKMIRCTEKKLQEIPMTDILFGSIGLIIGLIIAYLITTPFIRIISLDWLATLIAVAVYLLLGYLGINLAMKRWNELPYISTFRRNTIKEKVITNGTFIKPKILDTSVIIDGRIFDICKTGFIEGPLLIPTFILQELRHIADSSDTLKRNRGRRGLDVLNRIQKELDISVSINEINYSDINEVDNKLLRLGQQLGGKIVTNDYNLNKVAEFQGVEVLNINELANAIKPVVLPGEEMIVQVVKDGKEIGQGVAYLDDGTMIVVEGGKKFVGEIIDVLVTSVLQTAAGRMIFAKPKSLDKAV